MDSISSTVLVLLVIIAILSSLLVSFTSAVLIRHSGAQWASVLYAAGGAFVGALTLSLLILNTLWPG